MYSKEWDYLKGAHFKNETKLYLNKAVKKKKVEEKPEGGTQGIQGSKQSSSCIFYFARRVASLWQ